MNDFDYTLSVRLMTYNHEKFIEQAIDGVMMQKTNFTFEVVIGDDFSTDKTISIIKKYKSTDKIKIKIIDRKKGDAYCKERRKRGRLYNFIDIVNNCKGKYIALLDGDDYWTDPLKIQKQVDFLESNQSYNAVCHNVLQMDEISKTEKIMSPILEEKDISAQDLALRNNIITLTMVFRNDVTIIKKFIDFLGKYPSTPVGDYVLNMYLAHNNKIKFLPQIMGVYRVHSSNIFSSAIYNDKKRIDTCSAMILLLDNLKKEFDIKFKQNFDIQQKMCLNELYNFRIKYIKDAEKKALNYINQKLLFTAFIRKKMNLKLTLSVLFSFLLPHIFLKIRT